MAWCKGILWDCQRKIGHCDWETGAAGSGATTSALAGSWLTLKELTGADLEVAPGSHLNEDDDSKEWKITIGDLAKRLAENTLELVDDGCWLKVVPKA